MGKFVGSIIDATTELIFSWISFLQKTIHISEMSAIIVSIIMYFALVFVLLVVSVRYLLQKKFKYSIIFGCLFLCAIVYIVIFAHGIGHKAD